METELNIRLPQRDVDFVNAYAKKHQVSVDEVIDRSLRLLRQADTSGLHPEVLAVSGILPSEIDAEAAHHGHLAQKHQ